jgi:hypothetical protein
LSKIIGKKKSDLGLLSFSLFSFVLRNEIWQGSSILGLKQYVYDRREKKIKQEIRKGRRLKKKG